MSFVEMFDSAAQEAARIAAEDVFWHKERIEALSKKEQEAAL